MIAQDRFEAASVALQDAVNAAATKLDEHAALKAQVASQADLQSQLTFLQQAYDALKAAHEDTLNRVADWAESVTAKLRSIAPE